MSRINLLTNERYRGCPVDRCTGRSTGMALRYVAQAMETPGVWITCADHHDNKWTRREIVRVCRKVVESLDLKFFEFLPESIRCCHVVKS
jgi:hypothetical protein